MESIQEQYQRKRTTAEHAVSFLHSGDVCASDIALGNSALFFEAVAKAVKSGGLSNITQHTKLDLGAYPFFREDFGEDYRGVSWFSQANARKAVNAGIADVMPGYYRDFPRLYAYHVKPDVFVAVVSPMDRHGCFSTGCSGSVAEAIMSGAKTVLLEVNKYMPRSLFSCQIHISQVTAFWENHEPLQEAPGKEPDEISEKIGGFIAEEIPNGATLQLGVGGIPDAVGGMLKDKRHLGIHTEMFVDSLMKLLDCGAVDNSAKPIHTGRTVATFALGSKRMYEYIDDNPMVAMLPVDYVNDPAVIARHPNFMSINSALEVDFYGQVCAESIGTKHISGTGGQRDFVRGATQSKGGRSYIAFASTANGGGMSRIRPTLTEGAVVSTGKNDVDNIVTEYGIARLRGRTLSQRAKALIAIAHPKFRDELTFAAKKQNIII